MARPLMGPHRHAQCNFWLASDVCHRCRHQCRALNLIRMTCHTMMGLSSALRRASRLGWKKVRMTWNHRCPELRHQLLRLLTLILPSEGDGRRKRLQTRRYIPEHQCGGFSIPHTEQLAALVECAETTPLYFGNDFELPYDGSVSRADFGTADTKTHFFAPHKLTI